MTEEQPTGESIQDMLRYLDASFSIYRGNYLELAATWHIYENDLQILHIEDRRRLAMLLDEVERLLHNYLASVRSLVDHTRIFKNRLDNEEFRKQYHEKLKEVNKSKCVAFVQNLRNYAHHYEIININATFSQKMGKSEEEDVFHSRHLYIYASDLLRFKKWKPNARKYMADCGESIELKTAIDKYHKLIFHFTRSIFDKISELYPEQYMRYITNAAR